MNAIGQVLNCRNAFEAPCRDILLDLFDDLFGANHVGKLSDNETHLSRSNAFNLDLGTSFKRTPPGFVGFFDTLKSNDHTAFGKVRPGDVSHEVGNCCLRILQKILGSSDRFCQIMGGNIRCHADGDSRGAIDKQLRESSR